MLRIGSLFSGIGGLELGLERAGLGPVVFQAEIDPFCRSVLRRHWPDALLLKSVQEVRVGRVPRVELVCGGFPCVDVSVSGKGKGLDGPHSGLWREFARVVRELRPSFVVVENVAALRRRGLDRVVGELASCGYDCTWDCVPAAAVGAPHRRDRLFVVAWRVPDAHGRELREQPERGPGAAREADERNAEPSQVGEALGDSDGARLEGRAQRQERGAPRRSIARARSEALANADRWRRALERVAAKWRATEPGAPRDIADGRELPLWPPASNDLQAWATVPAAAQPAVCGVADVVPDRVQRLRALGNAVVPAVAEVVGYLVLDVARADARQAATAACAANHSLALPGAPPK